MVAVGAAFITEPVVADSAVVGLHVYVSAAPVTVKVAESPRQTEALLTVICGRGLTMMRMILAAEVQLLAVAVTLKVAVCTDVVLFTVVKLAILPVPEAASPIVVLLFVHLIVDVDGTAVNVIVPVACAGQSVRSAGTVSVGGLGLDNTIGPRVFDTHPFSVTLILVYVPAVRPLITMVPVVDEVRDTGVMATPFLA